MQAYGHTCTMDQKKYIQELLDEFVVDTVQVTTPIAANPSSDDTKLSDGEARRPLNSKGWWGAWSMCQQ